MYAQNISTSANIQNIPKKSKVRIVSNVRMSTQNIFARANILTVERRTGWQWGGFYGEQYLSASDTSNTTTKTRETKTKKDRNHRDKGKNNIFRLWHLEHRKQNLKDKMRTTKKHKKGQSRIICPPLIHHKTKKIKQKQRERTKMNKQNEIFVWLWHLKYKQPRHRDKHEIEPNTKTKKVICILLKCIEQITSLGVSTANMSDRLHCSIFLLFPFAIYDPPICHRLLATALLFLYVFLLVLGAATATKFKCWREDNLANVEQIFWISQRVFNCQYEILPHKS